MITSGIAVTTVSSRMVPSVSLVGSEVCTLPLHTTVSMLPPRAFPAAPVVPVVRQCERSATLSSTAVVSPVSLYWSNHRGMLTDFVGKCKELYCEILCEILANMQNTNNLSNVDIIATALLSITGVNCEILCEILANIYNTSDFNVGFLVVVLLLGIVGISCEVSDVVSNSLLMVLELICIMSFIQPIATISNRCHGCVDVNDTIVNTCKCGTSASVPQEAIDESTVCSIEVGSNESSFHY